MEKEKNRGYMKELSGEKAEMMENLVKQEESILALKSENEKLSAERTHYRQMEE